VPTHRSGGPETADLTPFQIEIARLFFTLPASSRLLLAGGAALVAQHLTTRPTRDLDFFTRDADDVPQARDQLERAVAARGWAVERIQDAATFCRLLIHGTEDLLVDIALDSAPALLSVTSYVGPTFAPEELAGRKLLALFDRAEARDFADVFTLAQRYGKDRLLARAAAADSGFDRRYLAGQIATIRRFTDEDLPVGSDLVAELREFFRNWHDELLG